MKIRTLLSVMTLTLLASAPAFAIDLQSARANGSVGETTQGYIAAVKPSAEVDALVAEVNAKRGQEYRKISAANGQSVQVVGTIAAEQIIKNLSPGSLYQAADGSWKKR
jgi:uncharacterized protein YdbL (DUF1318 family)